MATRPFDPERDAGKPLLELRWRPTDTGGESYLAAVDVDPNVAAETPWYYWVDDENPQEPAE